MEEWIRKLGIVFMGIGILGVLFGNFNRSIPSEQSAFYISMFLLIVGLIIESINLLKIRKKSVL